MSEIIPLAGEEESENEFSTEQNSITFILLHVILETEINT